MDKMDEKILVVDREYLFENEKLTFQGLLTDGVMIKRMMKKFSSYEEVRRGDAEENPKWKQPIPYVMIKRGEEVFLYKRLSGGGEGRLHDQLSIGVGGHMNRINDVQRWETNLMMNLYRELNEELVIKGNENLTSHVVGLINDDENEVGRVHIGILVLLELPEHADVIVRETDTLEGCWVRTKDLKKEPLFTSLETWSRIATDVLIPNAK